MNIATKKFFFVQFLLDASVCLTCVHIIVLPRVRHSEMLFITVLSPKEILILLFQKDGADFNRWRWQTWLHLWQNHCFYTGHSFYTTFHWCAVYSFLLLGGLKIIVLLSSYLSFGLTLLKWWIIGKNLQSPKDNLLKVIVSKLQLSIMT